MKALNTRTAWRRPALWAAAAGAILFGAPRVDAARTGVPSGVSLSRHGTVSVSGVPLSRHGTVSVSGATHTRVMPVSSTLADSTASLPPMAAGLSLSLPAALFLYGALRQTRSPRRCVCPVCRSRRGADVGRVGAYRNARRCHTCGFLWRPVGGGY